MRHQVFNKTVNTFLGAKGGEVACRVLLLKPALKVTEEFHLTRRVVFAKWNWVAIR